MLILLTAMGKAMSMDRISEIGGRDTRFDDGMLFDGFQLRIGNRIRSMAEKDECF